MYVSISEETAIEIIERLEERNAQLNKSIDARWEQIDRLANDLTTQRNENAELRSANAYPQRECRLEHFPLNKISAIRLVRNVMGIGLKEAKEAVDAAIAAGKVNL